MIPKNGYKFVVKFNPNEVAESEISNGIGEEEEAMEEEESVEQDEIDDEYDEDGKLPFNVQVQIHRDGVSKSVSLDLDVTPSYEGKGYDVFITNLSLEKEGSNYLGPSYDSCDEELREVIDELASKNFRKYMPFISEYSRAVEAVNVEEWLKDMKEVVGN